MAERHGGPVLLAIAYDLDTLQGAPPMLLLYQCSYAAVDVGLRAWQSAQGRVQDTWMRQRPQQVATGSFNCQHTPAAMSYTIVSAVLLAGLAICLKTLADYVGEVAPTAGSYWVSATASTHSYWASHCRFCRFLCCLQVWLFA
jgi:hypothetical protein